jgi:hypothetical protein
MLPHVNLASTAEMAAAAFLWEKEALSLQRPETSLPETSLAFQKLFVHY